MSVIFGIKENNRIIIAGDKRGSSIDGKTLSDDLDKVLMINDHLAFSSAGNAAIEKAISIDLNKATNKDCLTTDDLLDIIKAFYKRVADTNCDAILALPFYFLIAGKEYNKWKASRVYVNKDAQKIIILEPSKEYTREDGTKGVSYNAKVVYDISETSAKDRQQEQEPKSMRELVSALIDASPVPCVPVGELELPAYYDSSQQTIFVKKGLSEEVLFVSMAKEVSAAVYDFKHNESRDASDFKSFCVAYMVSSRYGVDTRGFDFSRLPREYAEMDTQAFKGELGTMRDVLGEIQSDMYKSMEKNKPAKNKEQER